jgi:hypothetical protein
VLAARPLRHVAVLQVVGEPGIVAADGHRDEAGVGACPVHLAALAVGPRGVTLTAVGVVRAVIDVSGDRAAAGPGLLAAVEVVGT